MRKLCQPTSCCCCINPRTGTLILGVLGTISSVLLILGTIAAGFVLRNFPVCQRDSLQNQDYLCMEIGLLLLAFCAIVVFCNGAVSVSLIYGVNKGTGHLMIPYIVLKGVQASLGGLFTIIGAAIYGVNGFWLPFALVLIVGALFVVLWVHFLMVVDSTRREIIESEEAPSTTGSELWNR